MWYNACIAPDMFLKWLVGGQHSTVLSNSYTSLPTSSGGPDLLFSPLHMFIFQKYYIQSDWTLDVVPARLGSSGQNENICCCLKTSSTKGQIMHQCDKWLCGVSPLSLVKYVNTSPFEISELCHHLMCKRQEKSGVDFCLRLNMFCTNIFDPAIE